MANIGGYQTDSQKSKTDTSGSDNREPSSLPSRKSPLSDTHSLPTEAHSWTREHLEELKLHIDDLKYHQSHPKDIVNLLIRPRPGQDIDIMNKQNTNLFCRLSRTAHAMGNSLAFSVINFPFESEELNLRNKMIKMLATRKDMWDLSGIDDDPKMAPFKSSFRIAGKEFTERLLYCIDRKENKETVTEYMYQHLFISFLQLFGLRCQFAPWMPKTSMRINGRTITGTPDVSINWMRDYAETSEPVIDWKTLIICGVKKEFNREEAPPPKQARYSSSLSVKPSDLPGELLGQHGAELLLCYPSSVKDDYIIGMIVEQTHVTFVALSITRKQYQQLMNGTLKDDVLNGPKIFVTKSYDYLVLKDRECLTEAFLTLGYLQNYGSEYFL